MGDVMDWQPIETAPRDGTPIWVIEPQSVGVHDAYGDDVGFWIIDDRNTWPSKPDRWQPKGDTKPEHPFFSHEWGQIGNVRCCKKCCRLVSSKFAHEECQQGRLRAMEKIQPLPSSQETV
jgi:hypothetical protein